MTEACDQVSQNVEAMHGQLRDIRELEDIVKDLEELTRQASESDAGGQMGKREAAKGIAGLMEAARKAVGREERAHCEHKVVQRLIRDVVEPYVRSSNEFEMVAREVAIVIVYT
jgi:hypothetical protein